MAFKALFSKACRYHMCSHDIKADQMKLHIGFCCIKGDFYFQKLPKFLGSNALVRAYYLFKPASQNVFGELGSKVFKQFIVL